jgi:DNA polymerase-3 subunit delta'
LEPEDVADGESEIIEGQENTKTKKRSQIVVPQVRALTDFFGLSTHRQGFRIVLICPAESLNPAAANALLKMLEEPPSSTLFILVSHQPQRLLPTIRSRCNKIALSVPKKAQAEAWLAAQGIGDAPQRLAYTGGSPLAALAVNEEAESRRQTLFGLLSRGAALDPFAAVALCTKDGMSEIVVALQKWGYDLLRTKLGGQVRYHPLNAASMQSLAKSVDLTGLLGFQRSLVEARRFAQHPLNLELQLESLLIQYTRMFPS